jgi:D-lactate dehydrogenase (cytochrome)
MVLHDMTNRIVALKLEEADISQVKSISDQEEITDTYALYLDDESHSFDGRTEKIVFPTSEGEIATILKQASETGVPITIQGARTGITGGAVPLGGITLNLEKMNDLNYIQQDDAGRYSISAECGVLLEDLIKTVSTKNLDDLKERGTSKQQEALQYFLNESADYYMPIDPTEMTALLGGIVACNASGARTFSQGAVRPWVKHLRVLLVNGDVLDIERGQVFAENGEFLITLSDGTDVTLKVPSYSMPKTKNAAGLYAKPDMDLIDLFIGCEGILGIISEVELWLTQIPESIMTVMAFFKTEDDAIGFVEDIRAPDSPVKMDLLEYLGTYAVKMIKEKASSAGITVPALTDETKAIIFFEFSYTEEDMEDKVMGLEMILNKHNTSSESSWAGLDHVELEKMKTVRHFVPETVNATIAMRKAEYHEVHKIGTDMAVPDAALREYLQFYRDTLETQGMEYVIWGHIGDNHLHVNIIPRNNEETKLGMDLYEVFARKAVELGGTVAAEHGIGKLKRPFLRIMIGESGIKQIRDVKRALDPKWLLNRGNMIPLPEGFSSNKSL